MNGLRKEIQVTFEKFRAEIGEDIARHTRASIEEIRGWIGAVDDKYRDTHPRIARLEVAVFDPPKRSAPKKRSRKRAA